MQIIKIYYINPILLGVSSGLQGEKGELGIFLHLLYNSLINSWK